MRSLFVSTFLPSELFVFLSLDHHHRPSPHKFNCPQSTSRFKQSIYSLIWLQSRVRDSSGWSVATVGPLVAPSLHLPIIIFFKLWIDFSRRHATLHLAVSVFPSLHPSVLNLFELRAVFAILPQPTRTRLGWPYIGPFHKTARSYTTSHDCLRSSINHILNGHSLHRSVNQQNYSWTY